MSYLSLDGQIGYLSDFHLRSPGLNPARAIQQTKKINTG